MAILRPYLAIFLPSVCLSFTTVILKCLTSLNPNWLKIYDTKHKNARNANECFCAKLAYLGPTAPLCSPFGYGQVLELVGGEDPCELNSHFMFGRTHGIMFGRTLFEYCVRKDTLHYVRKDTLHYVRKDTLQNTINKTF